MEHHDEEHDVAGHQGTEPAPRYVFLPRERRIPVYCGENDNIEAVEWGEEVLRFVAARHMTEADAVDYAIFHMEEPVSSEVIRRHREVTLIDVTRFVVD